MTTIHITALVAMPGETLDGETARLILQEAPEGGYRVFWDAGLVAGMAQELKADTLIGALAHFYSEVVAIRGR